MAELYAFQKLAAKLNIALQDKDYVISRENNFSHYLNNKKIQWRPNGIYIFKNGIWQKRYIYLNRYKIDTYKHPPKFHLVKCEKIREIGFHYYSVANTELVDVFNTDRNTTERNLKLEICQYCLHELNNSAPRTTEDFLDVELFRTYDEEPLDMFKYPKHSWKLISKRFKEKYQDSCQRCGYKEKLSNLEVHHKNRKKSDCRLDNLETLCRFCHFIEHSKEKSNMHRRASQTKVKSFIKENFKFLQENNKYFKKILKAQEERNNAN